MEENIRNFKRSRHISKLKTLVMLAFTILTMSCSKALLNDDDTDGGNHNLIITGIISEGSAPLEGIKVTFNADNMSGKRQKSLTQTVYSDSKGIYWISIQDLSGVLSCSVTAKDLQNRYNSQTCTLTVDWSGPSLVDNTFYVNDLNISLTKADK